MASDPESLLREVIEPLVTAEGLDLEALEVSLVGRRRQVRVIVDADGGVDLDRCADLSRVISAELDANDDLVGAGSYTLEVSSRGVSSPLTRPRHWRRNIGRLVRVVSGAGELTGRIRSADDEAAVLDVEGAERVVDYDDVKKAKIQVEFRRVDGE
ncbi:MAG TPA: ribosome maturation factor RimP [Jiangellaceae bacterium]